MKIRNAQLEALSRQRHNAFVDRLSILIEEALPEYFWNKSADDVRAEVSRLVAEATRIGFSLENEIGQYVQARIESGERFEQALADYPAFEQIVHDPAISTTRKLALIEQRLFSLE